eukprot:6205552-Pleurochrysis_carterae.AAC.8
MCIRGCARLCGCARMRRSDASGRGGEAVEGAGVVGLNERDIAPLRARTAAGHVAAERAGGELRR